MEWQSFDFDPELDGKGLPTTPQSSGWNNFYATPYGEGQSGTQNWQWQGTPTLTGQTPSWFRDLAGNDDFMRQTAFQSPGFPKQGAPNNFGDMPTNQNYNELYWAGNRLGFPTFTQNVATNNINVPQQYRGDRWYGLLDPATGRTEYQYRVPSNDMQDLMEAISVVGMGAMGLGGAFGFNPLGDLLGSFGFGDIGGLGSLFGNSGGGWLNSIGNFFGGAGDIGGFSAGGMLSDFATPELMTGGIDWPMGGYLDSAGNLASGFDFNSVLGGAGNFSMPGLDQYVSGFEDLPFGESGGFGDISGGGNLNSLSDIFNNSEFSNWASGYQELVNTPLPSNPTFDTNLVEGLNANNQFGGYTGGSDPLEAGAGSSSSPSLDTGAIGGDPIQYGATDYSSTGINPTTGASLPGGSSGSSNILDRMKNMKLTDLFRLSGGIYSGLSNMNRAGDMRDLLEEYSVRVDPFGSQRPLYQSRLNQLFSPEGQRAAFDEWMRGAGGTMRDQAMARLAATGRRANPAPLTTMLNRGFMSNLNNQQQLLGNLAGAQFGPGAVGSLAAALGPQTSSAGAFLPVVRSLGSIFNNSNTTLNDILG